MNENHNFTFNGRWFPSEDDPIPDDEPLPVAEIAARIQTRLAELDPLIRLVMEEGWPQFEAELKELQSTAYALLRSGRDMTFVARAQGRLEMLDAILAAPESWQFEQRALHEQLSRMEEGSTE